MARTNATIMTKHVQVLTGNKATAKHLTNDLKTQNTFKHRGTNAANLRG